MFQILIDSTHGFLSSTLPLVLISALGIFVALSLEQSRHLRYHLVRDLLKLIDPQGLLTQLIFLLSDLGLEGIGALPQTFLNLANLRVDLASNICLGVPDCAAHLVLFFEIVDLLAFLRHLFSIGRGRYATYRPVLALWDQSFLEAFGFAVLAHDVRTRDFVGREILTPAFR
ncbi:hypothetical protein HG530_012298 [Fusarium avenaceum]|nr:hypothetical protein HG530_012298 [Fusarium avenaceum]